MKKRLTSWLATVGIHLIGVTLITGLLFLPYLDSSVLQSFWVAWEDAQFRAFAARDLAIHVALSVCVWALLYITYRLIVLGRERSKRRVMRVARGTAITEFLIVFPVWCIVSMGIAQLAVNNVAAILVNLGAFQAARTVFVWAGEAEGNRRGVGFGTVATKARVAAAMAIAPAAPGDYFHIPFLGGDTFKKARAGMLAQQLPLLTSDQGKLGIPLAYALELEDPKGIITPADRNNLSLTRSLDATSFRLRSVRKFTWAYQSTQVVPFYVAGRAGAVVLYSHQIAMPLVPQVFGSKAIIAGRSGYYMLFTRQFQYNKQLPANNAWPR